MTKLDAREQWSAGYGCPAPAFSVSRTRRRGPPDQNIENNPMQSRIPRQAIPSRSARFFFFERCQTTPG
jgi:hypothetical protein